MELDQFEREKNRAILRSKAKGTIEGEQCTRYILGLEKRGQCNTYIHEINKKKMPQRTTWRYWRACRSSMELSKGSLDEGSMDTVLESVESRLSVDDRITITDMKGSTLDLGNYRPICLRF